VLFLKSDLEKAKERKIEEYYYNIVAKELEQNRKHNPTWVKAIAKSKGDAKKANSFYIDYRIQSLKDDAVLQEEENSQKEAKRILDEERKRKKYLELEKERGKYEQSKPNPYVAFLLFSLLLIGIFSMIKSYI